MILTGKVVDAVNGEPLEGASIMFRDVPSIGTAADSNGEFMLTDADMNDPTQVLTISDVGYNSIEYTIDEMPAKVLLAKTGNTLAEVIVSAHKVTRKKGFWPFAIVSVIALLIIFNYKKILKWSAPASLLLLFFSCSSVKKVNKDEDKQLKVINAYVKKHPYKNDTLYKTVKGDTIKTVESHTDTLYEAGKTDTSIRYKIIARSLIQKYYIHDTTETTVIDRANEEALRQVIAGKEIDINDRDMKYQEMKTEVEKCKTDVEKYKAKAQRWFYLFLILLILNTAYAYLKIKRVF